MSAGPTQVPAASSHAAAIHVTGSPTAEELAALVAPRVVEAARNAAILKGGFADF